MSNPTPEALARAREIEIRIPCSCWTYAKGEQEHVCPVHVKIALALDAHAVEQSALVEAMEAQRLSLSAANESYRRAMDTIVERLRGALGRIGLYTHNAREQHPDTFFSDCPATACRAARAALALVPADVVERERLPHHCRCATVRDCAIMTHPDAAVQAALVQLVELISRYDVETGSRSTCEVVSDRLDGGSFTSTTKHADLVERAARERAVVEALRAAADRIRPLVERELRGEHWPADDLRAFLAALDAKEIK